MTSHVAPRVDVVGGGLAGSEAAWQLAQRGAHVVLHEMRPGHPTPAHQTDRFAELVCSNTFKSTELSNAQTPNPLLSTSTAKRIGRRASHGLFTAQEYFQRNRGSHPKSMPRRNH